MGLMEAEAKKRILEEVSARIKTQVAELAVSTARDIIAQKLDIITPAVPKRPPEAEEPAAEPVMTKEMEVKSALAEEILTLSTDDALRRLKLSLAKGEIDEKTFRELKGLVEPVTKRGVCPQCGRELEPTVNFCRFCGARVK